MVSFLSLKYYYLISKNMNLAPSYVSAIAIILAGFLPEVDAPFIETTLNSVVVLVGALVVAIRQVLNKRSTVAGFKP